MNAPAAIRPRPRRDTYIPVVTAHLPGCGGKELELRCNMLLMRDRAAARLAWITEEPGYVLEHIQRLATAHALRSMALDELDRLHYAMTKLGTAAADLSVMFPAAPAEGGDARG